MINKTSDTSNNDNTLLLQENTALKERVKELEEKCKLLEFALNTNDNKHDIHKNNLSENSEYLGLKLFSNTEFLKTNKSNNFIESFEPLFINTPAGIAILETPEHIFSFANPIYEKIISRENIVGMRLIDVLPEIKDQGFIEILDNVYNTGQAFIGNETLVNLKIDNKLKAFYFNFIYQPIFSSDNKARGIIVFCFDVTAQVVSRQEVQELNIKLESINNKLQEKEKDLELKFKNQTQNIERERKTLYDLFMNAPAIICVFRGEEHIYEFVNPEYQKLYGYRELVGKTVRESLPELEGQVFFDLLDNVYATGEPFVGNEIVAHIDPYQNGKIEQVYFNFIYQPTFDNENNVNGIMVFAFDITQQVKARKIIEDANEALIKSESDQKELSDYLENIVKKRTKELNEEKEALRESENNFEMISENIPNLLWTAKPSGEADYYNKKFLSFVGKTFEEMQDWGWMDFVHPEDIEQVKETWIESLKTGKLYETEYRLKKSSDNKYYWFISRALPLYDESNTNIIKWFGVCTEINDQKLTEQKLESANHELERFSYIASHDLQSPIRTIVSYSKLIQRRYEKTLDNNANDLLNTIIKASMTMKNLIDDLLSFSKIGKDNIILKDVSIKDIIDEIVNANEDYIKEENAIVNYSSLPVIKSEPIYMYQLFQNLISNAIKYQRPDIKAVIEISATKKDTYWLFKVADNGIGIEKQYFERIFEPFKRLHSNDEYTGSGIGLATVKKIIELYGGKIWVESEFGQGTTFYFTIPLR